jgi:hypothetical protein
MGVIGRGGKAALGHSHELRDEANDAGTWLADRIETKTLNLLEIPEL